MNMNIRGGSGYRKHPGFTIVELLIVIVVIGILATLTFVAYNGIQNQAHAASLKSDLTQAGKQLESYRVATSSTERYPSTLALADLSASQGTSYTYQVNNSSSTASFCLSATKSSISYRITNTNLTPSEGTCSGLLAGGDSCPAGFIVVPGNSLFGTNDFCVAKYETKIVGQNDGRQTYASSFVPESRASGTPWVNINLANAMAEASTICSGCHLITESEWMTIAANVLSVASNWTGGAVGYGSIYRGHGDSSPSNPLPASTNDSDGYYGTGNSGASNQRRTLFLTNGEVIWDLSGNVRDSTSGTIASGQQPGLAGETAFAWKEWTDSLVWGGFPLISRPSAISSQAATWSSTEGIGRLYSNYADGSTRQMLRGGDWYASSYPGVLSLNLGSATNISHPENGFRITK